MVTHMDSIERRLAADENLMGLVRGLAAHRRVELLVQHLRQQTGMEMQSNTMLVPLPGTFEHDQWQNTLAAMLPRSDALRVILNDWTKGFSAGDSRLSRALRRIRMFAAHLTPMNQRLTLEI